MEHSGQGAGANQNAQNPTDPKAAATPVGGATKGAVDQKGNAVQEAAQAAQRKLKIQMDNAEVEVDEDEVIKVYRERKGHQRIANKEYQEGLKAKKEASAFLNALKNKDGLFEAIKRLGHDPRKLAEEYLAGELEVELLDPKEKELRMTRKELEAFKEREKRDKEEKQKQFEEKMKAKYAEEYTKQFTDALQRHKLPATKQTVADMARYIKRAADIKMEISADEAAKLVKEDIESGYSSLYGQADPEVLVKLLGEETLKKLRQYDAGQLKDPNAFIKTPTEQPEEIKRLRDKGGRFTPQQWRAFNRK